MSGLDNSCLISCWIRQTLLKLITVHGTTISPCPVMAGDVQVLFRPVPTPDVQANISSVNVTQTEKKARDKETTKGVDQGERPKFWA